MTQGWREMDGLPAGLPLAAGLATPPAVQGIIPADPGPIYIALWFDSASKKVSRARVVAWRISGPQAWPVTMLPVEATFLKRPDGVVFNIATGERWDDEGDWMAAQP